MIYPNAKPNLAHHYFSELETSGKNIVIITQNIDGLHQMAGSKEVLELHGSVHRVYCSKCYKKYDESVVNESHGVPKCACGGVIRPDVVLYEEPLDDSLMSRAINYIRNADVLIIGGTSLNVYPAAGLTRCVAPGTPIYLIDPNPVTWNSNEKVHHIVKGASEGMKELFSILNISL